MFVDSARETHKTATWEAPPTPKGATVHQDSSNDALPLVSLKAHATGEYVLQVFLRDFCSATLVWWCPHSLQSVPTTTIPKPLKQSPEPHR